MPKICKRDFCVVAKVSRRALQDTNFDLASAIQRDLTQRFQEEAKSRVKKKWHRKFEKAELEKYASAEMDNDFAFGLISFAAIGHVYFWR